MDHLMKLGLVLATLHQTIAVLFERRVDYDNVDVLMDTMSKFSLTQDNCTLCCARVCVQISGCVLFAHNPTTSACVCSDTTLLPPRTLGNPVLGWRYYQMLTTPTSTTSTTTTTTTVTSTTTFLTTATSGTADCSSFAGWTKLDGYSTCFSIVEELKNWDDAQVDCMNRLPSGTADWVADLIVLDTRSKWEAFVDKLLEIDDRDVMWIGLNDYAMDNSLRWTNGQYMGQHTLTWALNQPAYTNDKDCVTVQKEEAFVFLCSSPKSYVCEITSV